MVDEDIEIFVISYSLICTVANIKNQCSCTAVSQLMLQSYLKKSLLTLHTVWQPCCVEFSVFLAFCFDIGQVSIGLKVIAIVALVAKNRSKSQIRPLYCMKILKNVHTCILQTTNFAAKLCQQYHFISTHLRKSKVLDKLLVIKYALTLTYSYRIDLPNLTAFPFQLDCVF